MSLQWDRERVAELICDCGHEFARMKTPWGIPAYLKSILKTKNLLGRCVRNSIILAYAHPDLLWYCEGFSEGTPHAWVCPKKVGGRYNEDWIIDPTWPWRIKKQNNVLDKYDYFGIRFEGRLAYHMLEEAWEEVKTLNGGVLPPGGASILSSPRMVERIYPGMGETYGF